MVQYKGVCDHRAREGARAFLRCYPNAKGVFVESEMLDAKGNPWVAGKIGTKWITYGINPDGTLIY